MSEYPNFPRFRSYCPKAYSIFDSACCIVVPTCPFCNLHASLSRYLKVLLPVLLFRSLMLVCIALPLYAIRHEAKRCMSRIFVALEHFDGRGRTMLELGSTVSESGHPFFARRVLHGRLVLRGSGSCCVQEDQTMLPCLRELSANRMVLIVVSTSKVRFVSYE